MRNAPRSGAYSLLENTHRMSFKMSKDRLSTGIIKRHPDGFGFFIPDDPMQADAYVPAQYMHGIMTHDRVECRVFQERKDRFWAKPQRLIMRHWKQVVAPVSYQSGRWIIFDSEGAWGSSVELILNQELKQQLKSQDLVVAEIVTYPDHPEGLRAQVVKILGPMAQAQLDVERIARSHHIPIEFSKETLKELKHFPTEVRDKDFANRVDLRSLPLVTIDGATAKDFDDAVYVSKNKNYYTLYVAIADVSHYVQAGTALDRDAYERGTSCYFPGAVIPMLPEILSNELCSLKPKVPRLSFVCEMQITRQGVLKAYRFYEAVIESKARLTYGLAQALMDAPRAKKAESLKQHIPEELVTPLFLSYQEMHELHPHILVAKELAEILLEKRLKEGSLDLEIPDIQVVVDAQGNPLEIIKTHRLFAHRLIEEFMLKANEATARFFEDHKVPGIYRVHESPKEEALENLALFARSLGLKIDLHASPLQVELRQAIDKVKASTRGDILANLILRSMKQAKYSAENIGHFGLNFSHYSHFTSPIRRYPDLLAHRQIKAVLNRKKTELLSQESLEQASTWLSATEQRAVKAERAVIAIKKARFIEPHQGEIFPAVVTGVTKFGIFLTLKSFEVEGLVHVDSLSKYPGSRWEFDEVHLTLTEKRSGKKFRIGDTLSVQLETAHIHDGKIDFVLAQEHKSQKIQDHKIAPQSSAKDPRLSSTQKSFDPGQKLIEALRKKGLKPSSRLLTQEGLAAPNKSKPHHTERNGPQKQTKGKSRSSKHNSSKKRRRRTAGGRGRG